MRPPTPEGRQRYRSEKPRQKKKKKRKFRGFRRRIKRNSSRRIPADLFRPIPIPVVFLRSFRFSRDFFPALLPVPPASFFRFRNFFHFLSSPYSFFFLPAEFYRFTRAPRKNSGSTSEQTRTRPVTRLQVKNWGHRLLSSQESRIDQWATD